MKTQSVMRSGFTLIELLIVIAVIAILAAVAFVAIDPATRINEAQDSERWSAANALLDAFLQSTVDNDGNYPASMSADGVTYMIDRSGSGSCTVSGCPDAVTQCIDLYGLVSDGYIASLPTDPDGISTYAPALDGTGYTINISTTGITTVKSCGAEEATITVAR